jgi:hypothetical protein
MKTRSSARDPPRTTSTPPYSSARPRPRSRPRRSCRSSPSPTSGRPTCPTRPPRKGPATTRRCSSHGRSWPRRRCWTGWPSYSAPGWNPRGAARCFSSTAIPIDFFTPPHFRRPGHLLHRRHRLPRRSGGAAPPTPFPGGSQRVRMTVLAGYLPGRCCARSSDSASARRAARPSRDQLPARRGRNRATVAMDRAVVAGSSAASANRLRRWHP